MEHDEQLEPEQIEAFEKALEILSEHFPNYVVLVQTRVDDGSEVCRHSYRGQHSTALGLMEQYKHHLLNMPG